MRTLFLLLRLLPFAVSFARDRRRFLVWGPPARRTDAFHQRRAQRLADVIPTLGPTFVKIGQVFSARPDVVPEPYLTALAALTDSVPCVPFPRIEKELETAFGGPVDRVFDAFDRAPLAAGLFHMAAGELWVIATDSRRSFDSRYFGPLPEQNVLAVVRPLLTWERGALLPVFRSEWGKADTLQPESGR